MLNNYFRACQDGSKILKVIQNKKDFCCFRNAVSLFWSSALEKLPYSFNRPDSCGRF